jgi:flagellar assembly factor FliW
MTIKTRGFGEIDIDENKVITFDEGIPGMPHLKKYLLMSDRIENSNLYWLQSIEDTDIAFVMMDIFPLMPDYSPSLPESKLDELGIDENHKDYLIFNIAVVPKELKKITVNLKAPVIINTLTNKGMQLICSNDEYPIKYYLFEEDKK